MSCNDDREPPAHPTLPVKSDSAPKVKREGGSGIVQHSLSSRRTVCDLCRQRRIRCDGGFPCDKCVNATLKCKRDHVPKKRGPKRGHGRVINELRAREKASGETESANANTSARTSDVENDPLSSAPRSAFTTAPSSPQACFIPWLRRSSSDSHYAPESKSPFSTDAYRPTSASYFHLIPRCVDLYYDHMYPIMPILYMPSIRAMIEHPLTPAEKNLVYALCALTAFHMSGQSILAPGPPSWEVVGRFFLDECIAVRQTYDFLDDASLFAVISSFWISTSFFEINQNRKSWYYLREAMTLALELRLHVNATYIGLREEEVLCRQRVFWILFVTERSFAILRNKPLTLRKMPSLPTKGHSYEGPDIHAGFIKLVKSYIPLDESFVNAWNDPSDPSVSKNTYLTLQNTLAKSLDCLVPLGRRSRPSSLSGPVKMEEMEIDDDYSDERVPNEIQKADLLMTQQWLRLIVWQSSFRQGLLSKYARNECMTFAFPLSIARDAATVIQSLPSSAIEVHGMGIFEKIFDIGTWLLNVLGAYDSGASTPNGPFTGATNGVAGMDFVGGELALLNQGGRSSVATDPLEFFVKTLSASPNSRTLYAEQLLRFATETGSGFKTALSPALSYQSTNSRTSSSGTESSWSGGRTDSTWSAVGTIVGEVAEEADADDTIAPLDLNGEPLANEESMIDELISSGLGVGAYHHQASSMNFGFGTGTGADAKDTTDYGMGLRSGLGLGMGMGLYTGNSGINNTNNASTTAAATTNNTTALDDSIPSRFAGPRVPWSEYGYGGFSSGSETERGGGLHTGSVCVPAPFPVVLPHIGTAQTLGSAEKTRMDDHRARVPRHPSGVMGGAW